MLKALGYEVLVVKHELWPDARIKVLEKFNDGNHPSQVLIISGPLSSGINLQMQCHTVVSLENDAKIPPLLQRAVRVNRIGQRHRQTILTLAVSDSYDQQLLSK